MGWSLVPAPRVLPGQHGGIHIKGSTLGLVPGLGPGQLVLQLQVRKQVLPTPQAGSCQSSLSGSRAEGAGFDITLLRMVCMHHVLDGSSQGATGKPGFP